MKIGRVCSKFGAKWVQLEYPSMDHFFLQNWEWYLNGSTFKFHSDTSLTKATLGIPLPPPVLSRTPQYLLIHHKIQGYILLSPKVCKHFQLANFKILLVNRSSNLAQHPTCPKADRVRWWYRKHKILLFFPIPIMLYRLSSWKKYFISLQSGQNFFPEWQISHIFIFSPPKSQNFLGRHFPSSRFVCLFVFQQCFLPLIIGQIYNTEVALTS